MTENCSAVEGGKAGYQPFVSPVLSIAAAVLLLKHCHILDKFYPDSCTTLIASSRPKGLDILLKLQGVY